MKKFVTSFALLGLLLLAAVSMLPEKLLYPNR